MMRILAGIGDEFQILNVQGLTMVGGSQGTGLRLPALKYKDDYAILSIDGNFVSVRPLKGKTDILKLKSGQSCAIQDLRLLAAPIEAAAKSESALQSQLGPFMARLSEREDMNAALGDLLRLLLKQFHFDRGLVIQKTVSDEFEVTTEIGVESAQPWLSESLIQATLTASAPVFISNLISSEFSSNRSLLATGFTSIFAWPLIVRGETLGALVAGSRLPHSGLSAAEKTETQVFAQMAALFLSFHRRDQKLKEEVELLRQSLKPNDLPLTTVDPQLLATCELAARVAATPLTVLIQGETGCGKEVLARWLHARSDRKSKPFVAINCGSIPSELLESMLFGHRKGSFTGAVNDQLGKFQQAHGGTLFLDEIGDLPETLQVKLLRVLQERVVEPLGSLKPVAVDVRILAASHKSLPALVEQGKFRSDLYYRLAEIALEIPPLRMRAQDIGLLALEFLKEFAPDKRFHETAWAWIKDQVWAGNTRELRTTIKRGALLSRQSEIQLEDLIVGSPLEKQEGGWLGGRSLDEARDRFVETKVREALKRADGKRSVAAKLLGLNERTFFRYLENLRDDLN